MRVRIKSRKRIAILAVVVMVMCGGLVAAYFAQQWRRDRWAWGHRSDGMAAYAAGKHQQAVVHLRKFLRRIDDDVDAIYRLAHAELQIPAPDGSHVLRTVPLLRRVLQLKPDHETASHELLELYTQAGYNTEATALAESLLGIDSSDPKALRAKAIALVRLRRFKDARPIIEDYVAMAESDLTMQFINLEVLQHLRYSQEQMISLAEALREKHPEDPRFELLQAYAYRLVNDRENAARWTLTAATRTPPDDEFTLVLVRFLDHANLFERSLAVLKQSADKTDNAVLHREIVRRLWEASRYKAVMDELIDLDSAARETDPLMLAFHALALFGLGQADEAEIIVDALSSRKSDRVAMAWASVLDAVYGSASAPQPASVVGICLAAVESDPKNPYFHAFLGNAYAAMGEHEFALETWQRATELRPIWAEPRKRRAHTFLATGRAQEGLREAQAVVQLARTSVDAAITWALARAANLPDNQADTAEKLLELVNNIQQKLPGEQRTLTLQIALLLQVGQKEKAADALKAALDRDKPLNEVTLIRLAELSRTAELGLEEACLARSEEVHGLTPRLAFDGAMRLASAGKPEDGLHQLESAMEDRKGGSDLEWQIILARYLEQIGDAQAQSQWVRLADANPDNAVIQRLAIKSRSVRSDREFVDRVIERIRAMAGEKSVTWRVERARWWLQSPGSERDVEKAVAMLKQVVVESPALVDARLLLAKGQERLGLVGQAIADLEAVARQYPNATSVALEMARLLQSQKEFERARQQLDQVIVNESASPSDLRRAAILLAQQGDGDKALEILQKLRAANTGENPDDDLLLARLYWRHDQIDEADEICRQILKRPSGAGIAFVAEFHASRGDEEEADQALAMLDNLELRPGLRELILADHYKQFVGVERAQEQYRAAIQSAPEDSAPWHHLVLQHLALRQTDAALAAVNEGLNAHPKDDLLVFLKDRTELLVQTRDDDRLRPLVIALIEESAHRSIGVEALETLASVGANQVPPAVVIERVRQLADAQPNFLALQNLLTRFYLALGRADDAVVIATRAMSAFPISVEPAQLATDSLAAAGRWDEVLVVASQWRKRTVQPMNADMMLAEAKMRLGQTLAASRQLEPYTERALENPDVYSRLIIQYARTLIADGKVNDAADLLAPSLEKSIAWRAAFVGLAVRSVDDPQTAAAWLEQAAAHMPVDAVDERTFLADAWLALARRTKQSESGEKARQEFGEKARQVLDDVVKLPEATASAWFLHGMLADVRGDYPTSESSYRAALKLAPQLLVVSNNLAMVLAKTKTDLTEALRLAEETVNAAPNNANYLDTLAHIQAKAEDYDTAIANMQSAIRLQPKNPIFQQNLANILIAAGRPEEANRILQSLSAPQPDAG